MKPLEKTGIALALLLLSFSTVLFTLVIFKLLSFFIMPSLFFDLLFIGFPLGAMLGTFLFQANMKSFIRSLWILQLALIVSGIAIMFAHNFDYLKVNLFNVQVTQLIINIGIFTILFLPFFIAYGLSEYIGYQVGRKNFKARMRTVYAIFLFGAAIAYTLTDWLIPVIGVSRLMLTAFMITTVAGAILTRRWVRGFFIVQFVLAGLCCLLPNLERNFLKLYKGSAPSSTAYFEARGYHMAYQQWGSYSLTEILVTPDSSAYFGFYNDFLQWEYYPERGYNKPSLGTIPLMMSDPDAKKLIIGSGGGRQVRFATVTGHQNITAVEIEPAVIAAVREGHHLLEEFQYVYDNPGVKIVQSEGRKYLEHLTEKQQLIYLPSVGGYPQMMLEPGNLIRTKEAYQLASTRLSTDGILAIWYPAGLDAKGILTDQYVRTLRDLDMQVKAYRNNEEFLILATPERLIQLPVAEDLMKQLVTVYEMAGGSFHSFPIPLIPIEYEVADDPHFQPVTDDRPYLGGNLRHIFSSGQIYKLYGFGGLVLLILGFGIYFYLGKRVKSQVQGRSFRSVALLAFCLGANFLVIEHHLVLLLFKANFVFHDAVRLGAVIFLILSGVGSIIATSVIRSTMLVVAVGCYLLLIGAGVYLPAWLVVILVVPAAIATGTFFPLLFERSAKNPLGVFALDAIGAGFGSLLAAAVPILFGLKVYGFIALVIFAITILIDKWFYKADLSKESHGFSEETAI